MNDWWNDPPEYPEEPEYDASEPSSDSDTWEEYAMNLQGETLYEMYKRELPPRCPHNNEWGSCARCDFDGDIAYDAQREKRT